MTLQSTWKAKLEINVKLKYLNEFTHSIKSIPSFISEIFILCHSMMAQLISWAAYLCSSYILTITVQLATDMPREGPALWKSLASEVHRILFIYQNSAPLARYLLNWNNKKIKRFFKYFRLLTFSFSSFAVIWSIKISFTRMSTL